MPLRFEIGQREMESGVVTFVRRDTGHKGTIKMSELLDDIRKELGSIQQNLFAKAKKFLDDNTHDISSYDEFKKIMETSRGFLKAFWCEDFECEVKIKEETKASTRCLPLDAKEETGSCIYCGKSATHRWFFAQAY